LINNSNISKEKETAKTDEKTSAKKEKKETLKKDAEMKEDAAAQINTSKGEEKTEEEVVVNMETIISELKVLYVQKHGTDPTSDIIEKWKEEVQNSADSLGSEGQE
jgi:hypothetical protein